MAVDKAVLLAFLQERAKSNEPLIVAVYHGLAERVRRGDFDDGRAD